MAATIALVDDDRNLLTSLAIALEAEGYEVRAYTDGASALDGILGAPVDLAVVDIKMPRMDGMELLRRLRDVSDVPVIFLTSRDDEIDQLLGLKMGADDYIPKPFSQRLLIERIRAVLRRAGAAPGSGANAARAGVADGKADGVIVRGRLLLDPSRHLCSWDEEPIRLTVTEFLILRAIANRPGHVKTRDQLLDAAYGEQIYVDDRTIDSHIKRLRKKFRAVDPDFSAIETLYGLGYKFKENSGREP